MNTLRDALKDMLAEFDPVTPQQIQAMKRAAAALDATKNTTAPPVKITKTETER